MTLDTLSLILLAAGLIPWRISRRRTGRRPRQRTQWQIYALFWRLTIDHPQARSRRAAWRLTIPLIQRLASAIWAALRRLVM